LPFKPPTKASEKTPLQAFVDCLGNLCWGRNEFFKIKNQTALVDQGKNKLFKIKIQTAVVDMGKNEFFKIKNQTAAVD
jgi:hypothetical protein